MRFMCVLLFIPMLGGWARAEGPPDLGKIDRTIKKEPAYKTKPKYCLVALGPKAETHLWFVLDGEVLYVDAKGTGDLTEAEQVKAQPVHLTGFLRPGERRPRALRYPCAIGKDLEVELMTIDGKPTQVDIRDKGRKLLLSTVRDDQGDFSFSDLPAMAPIVRAGGNLEFRIPPGFFLRKADIEARLTVHVGTRGLGAGTCALVDCDSVSRKLHPVAEVEFPAKDGGKATRVRCVLDGRC